MRADARANRQAILAAARQLYAERGAGVTFNAIAEAAGVGIATLYSRFPTPEDLKVGLAEEVGEQIAAIAEPALAQMETDPEAGWRTFAHRVADLRLAALLPYLAADVDPHALPPRLEEQREAILGTVAGVVRRAQAAGLVADGVTPVQFHLGLAWITRPLPAAAEAMSPGQTAWMLEIYLRGLRP